MAVDSAACAIARPGVRPANRLADAGFVAFLLLIFVTLAPFAVRDPNALAAGESGFGGAGDALRQICYLGVFGLIVAAALRQQGLRVVTSVPLLLAALLLWCALRAAWSPEAGVTLRRAALAAVIVISAMLSVSTVGAARALELWRYVLAGVLIVNWISIPVIHQAIHLPGEIDPSLVGDWRGLYFHKNIAGAVSAISAIVFFFSFLNSRRAVDAVLFAAAVGFTVMTHSKSSIGLLPVAIGSGLVYRAIWHRGIDRLIAVVFTLLAAALLVALAVADSSVIMRALEDPTQFTGRSAIWQAEIAFIRDHPLLGSGFGSFADTGTLSPLYSYVGASWVQNTSHGHNAYLQLLVTVGGVGFALAILALVLRPAIAFWRTSSARSEFAALLFAVFVFMLFHNFLESDFL